MNVDIQVNTKVAIFGEVLADVFPDEQVMGGAPFNVARHLQALGLAPLLISRIGDDPLGEALLQEMQCLGMTVDGIQRDVEHPTGQVQVRLEDGRHRFEILPDQAYDHLCPQTTCQQISTMRPAMAYFGSLVQRSEKSRLAAAQFVAHCHCPRFLDINLRAPWYDAGIIASSLQHADVVKLNDEELGEIAGLFDLDALHPEAQALKLQQRFGLQQVLVTCGASGSWLLDDQQRITRVAPVEGVQVVDTVGAGDAYAAVFMLGQIRQWDVSLTMQRASEYAAAICGVRGAAAPSAGFVLPFLQAWGMT